MKFLFRVMLLVKRLYSFPALESRIDQFWDDHWQKEQAVEELLLQREGGPPLRGSERPVLIEQIADTYPFQSVFEVGCGYAQNFHTLAPLFPGVRFVGVDKDPGRISEGQKLVEQNGIKNVMLAEARAEDLRDFPDNCADIVICSALLLYIRQGHLPSVFSEMRRIARRHIFILEQQRVDPAAPDEVAEQLIKNEPGRPPYFVRNYRPLLESCFPAARIEEISVPNPRWEIEQWRQYAALFRIDL